MPPTMLDGSTLFFIGAGASCSYGFPCGNELVNQICDDLAGDSIITRYLRDTIEIEEERLGDFAHIFQRAKNTTIDEFLKKRRDLRDIGRKVVAAKLITYERPEVIRKSNNDWFSRYLRFQMRGCTTYNDVWPVLQRKNFYTLNYDRSLEFALFGYLDANFPVTDSTELEQRLGRIRAIEHPHGMLGRFTLDGEKDDRPYTPSLPSREVFDATWKRIQFWDEHSNSAKNFEILNTLIRQADTVVFLGFGFHEHLLSRFAPNIFAGKQIYCSAMGLTEDRWRNVLNLLVPGFSAFEIPPRGTRQVGLVRFSGDDQTCDEFMREILGS